jgi:anaerobic selenocysteine-containing dehydrogenase
VRQNGRIVSVAVIVAVGVSTDGRREVLGMDIGPSEAEPFWTEFLRKLARRGLRGVKLVISDAHGGLKAAISKAETANGEKALTIMYALGWTQHSCGAQNIRAAAMIQLLCGNIGIPGGGVNALRGHSNVRGITDVGTLTAAVPGYLALPRDSEPTLEATSPAGLSRRSCRTRPATGRTTRASTSAS